MTGLALAVEWGGVVAGAAAVYFITGYPKWWGIERSASLRARGVMAGLAGLVVWTGLQAHLGLLVIALWAGVLAGGADLAERVIPHRWVGVMMVPGVVRLLVGQVPWGATVMAALAITAFFLAVNLVTHSGLGMGDVKLAFALSLTLGWPQALTATVVGLWAGGLYALYLLLTRRARKTDGIPLGPFLVLGLVVAAVWTA